MKSFKIFTALVLALLFTFSAQAQLKNRFSIGPRAGVNFASINSDVKSRSGLVLGITTTYSFNEKTGLTVDALYSSKGYDNFVINYFSLPILYNAFYGKLGQDFRPKVYAGVAPGFLLNTKISSQKTNFNNTSLDIVGGAGFNYRLANRVWLNADLRAFLGVSNLRSSGDDVRNRTIQLSLGVSYGI